MTMVQRVSRIIGGVAILGVLMIAAMVTWSVLRPADPGPSLPLAEGPALGDLTGYVGRVDRAARTLHVTDNLLGLRPVMLVVTDDTTIKVDGKQGALGDLSKDVPVRVFYEVRGDVKYVTSLQVITGGAQASGATATDAGPMVQARPAAASPPAAEPAPPVAVIVAPPPPASPPPAPAPAPTPRPALAAPAPTEAASIGPPPASTAETDAGDGSVVIDWLFESRRR